MSASLLWPMKKGDLFPYLQVKFYNPDGTAMPLTGRLVTFRMGSTVEAPLINAAATVTDAAGGTAEYRWVAGDTDLLGTFRAEFVLDGPDTYPKDGYFTISITDDVGT